MPDFTSKIAELSDNRFLAGTIRMLCPHMHFIGKFVRSAGRTGFHKGKRGLVGEHLKIVVALESGNSAAALAVMIEHIDGFERRLFRGGIDGG